MRLGPAAAREGRAQKRWRRPSARLVESVPALAVKPLELHKGIGTKGAIINMPFMNITGIMVIRHDRFNPGDGQKLRNFSASLLDPALGVSALDVAKRLLDYGYHAPTVYFPLLVPECLLIEPTETESLDMLDGFVAALVAIAREARDAPDLLHGAPHTLPVRRLDEVRAARQPDLAWRPA